MAKEETKNAVPPELIAARQQKLQMQSRLLMHLAGITGNANTTMDRSALLRALNSDRDYNFECGYPDTLSQKHYQDQYDREGIAKRVVTIYPEECWRVSPNIYETEEADETEFEQQLKELDDEKHLFQMMMKIDVMSGIGRYGILLLGLDDGLTLDQPADGVNPETGEVTGSGREHKLIYLRAFSESALTIEAKEHNETSPRFGLPTYYKVNFQDDDIQGSTFANKRVHWSRVIHVADNLEASLILGVPRMQIVFNRLLDARKVLAGSGEMFWKGGFPGYAFEVNPQLTEATLDVNSLKEQFRLYSEGLQRYLAIEGVTAKSLTVQVADPTGHLTAHVKAIAMSLGVPYRIFMGSEEAKLASTEDKDTWNGRLARRQENYLSPMLIRPFIDRLQAFGVLSETPDGYTIDWPDLDAPGDKDIAEVAKALTEALSKYQAGGVDDLIPPDEFLKLFLKMSQEEVEAIAEARSVYIGEKDTEREEELARRESDLSVREEATRKQEELQGQVTGEQP